MNNDLLGFFKSHPFWAVFVIAFMVLPMIGAVVHIILKAMGRRGIDDSPPTGHSPAPPEDGRKPVD